MFWISCLLGALGTGQDGLARSLVSKMSRTGRRYYLSAARPVNSKHWVDQQQGVDEVSLNRRANAPYGGCFEARLTSHGGSPLPPEKGRDSSFEPRNQQHRIKLGLACGRPLTLHCRILTRAGSGSSSALVQHRKRDPSGHRRGGQGNQNPRALASAGIAGPSMSKSPSSTPMSAANIAALSFATSLRPSGGHTRCLARGNLYDAKM
jgi:hypothetical protein